MKDEARYNLWTQFLEVYKEYFVSDDERWFQIFEELKTFIDANKRKPLTISKIQKEIYLNKRIS
jgi:hypothetical protein